MVKKKASPASKTRPAKTPVSTTPKRGSISAAGKISKKAAKVTAKASAVPKKSVSEPSGNSSAKKSLGKNLARIRMYRQGLGDCFLLTFAGNGGKEFHVLIDCGVILGTPDPQTLMQTVVKDIIAVTNGHINVLVATHEHWDHISGFNQAKVLFDSIKVDRVWLAWTENPEDLIAKKLRKDRMKKVAALWLGFEHLNSLAADQGRSPEAISAGQILSFFGIDPDEPCPPLGGNGFGARVEATMAISGGKTGVAMDWVKTKIAKPEYWTPGDVIDLREDAGLRVYVLGPPTDPSFMKKTLPTKIGHETYEDHSGGDQSSTGANAFMAAAFGAQILDEASTSDSIRPFDQNYQISASEAVNLNFFRDHYYQPGASTDAWRRIDGVGMTGVGEFALQLDSETNNTSLALAFELADGRVLLFPGDAQVGNWESWHVDGDKTRVWNVKEGRETRTVTAEQLLNKTVVYKVGHHGSHNATLRERGLEMMIDPDLVALVPVDTHIAHDIKTWKLMPFEPLIQRLDEKTSHRTVKSDSSSVPNNFEVSADTITVDGPDGKKLTRPLYVDYFLAPS